jgi:hypothetical protein
MTPQEAELRGARFLGKANVAHVAAAQELRNVAPPNLSKADMAKVSKLENVGDGHGNPNVTASLIKLNHTVGAAPLTLPQSMRNPVPKVADMAPALARDRGHSNERPTTDLRSNDTFYDQDLDRQITFDGVAWRDSSAVRRV